MTSTSIFTQARSRIEAAVLEKAAQDTAFRTLLTSDPHAALKQLVGIDPIPSYRIRVVEEQPGEITLVLPSAIDLDELPEELLDLASGGTSADCQKALDTFFTPMEGRGLF